MLDDFKMELEGADDLIRELKRFGPAVANKAGDKGLREAAKVVRQQFKAAAPIETGHLRSAMTFRYYPRAKKAIVGLGKSGKRFANGRAKIPFYYKTLEFRSARGAAMHPFMEQAWNRVRENVARLIITETKKAVNEEAIVAYGRSLRRRAGRR